MYWLYGSKWQLSTENKLLLYKTILKSIRAYDIQLWDMASNSNIEILQRYYKDFKTKSLELLLMHFDMLPMTFYIMTYTLEMR